MKKVLKKIAVAFSHIIRSNTFFKIISVFIGIFVWLYIINIVNPLKSAEYTKIPVRIDLVGSVPEYYGLSLVQGIPSVFVTVNVEGSRSGLLKFNKDKLTASLDLNSVDSAGGYTLDIVVKSADSGVTVTSVEPPTLFCEFDTTTTRNLTVGMSIDGQLPTGYVINEYEITPVNIDITGPTSVVSKIDTVNIPVSISGKTGSFSGTENVVVRNSDNENISKSTLTFSSEEIAYTVDIAYHKDIPFVAKPINNYGGDESSYIGLSYSVSGLTVEGDESYLASMNELNLGNIGTETLTTPVTSFELPLPTNTNYKYVDSDITSVTVTLSYDPNIVSTRDIVFYQNDIENFKFINCPEGKTPKIVTNNVSLSIRGIQTVINGISKDRINCVVDLSDTNAYGQYAVNFYMPDNIAYGLLKRVYVGVEYTDAALPSDGNTPSEG